MKRVFITGGSGTVGSNFIEHNIEKYQITSYSRNEKAQVALKRRFPKVDIILGSVEDRFTLENALRSVKPEILIHAAALKHVDTAEKQPSQVVQSNIIGSKNIIDLSVEINIPITIGISTDKACNPNNLYGFSKKIMEKMFIEANNEKNLFCCTRFGNVAGSNGSVIPFWINCKKQNKPLPLTSENMTRLMLDGKQVSSIIEKCIFESENKNGGFILSKKMKKINLKDLAKLISENIKIVGLRPGEMLHEDLISIDEIQFTRVEGEYIFIENHINQNSNSRLTKTLSSNNAELMMKDELILLIKYVKNRMKNTLNY
tara:strand:+ start:38 stop:985 length:948 start_codon:yes stop_codon:yes gene_type:complete